MVASPANANSNQRYITLEASGRAGFTVLGAMNEPSAAAVEFLHRYNAGIGPKSPKRYVAVSIWEEGLLTPLSWALPTGIMTWCP